MPNEALDPIARDRVRALGALKTFLRDKLRLGPSLVIRLLLVGVTVVVPLIMAVAEGWDPSALLLSFSGVWLLGEVSLHRMRTADAWLYGGPLLGLTGAVLVAQYAGAPAGAKYVAVSGVAASLFTLILVRRLRAHGVDGYAFKEATAPLRPYPVIVVGYFIFVTAWGALGGRVDQSITNHVLGSVLGIVWWIAILGPGSTAVQKAIEEKRRWERSRNLLLRRGRRGRST